MSFKFVKQLPSPEEIKEMSPVTEEMKKVKETRDRLIQDVITTGEGYKGMLHQPDPEAKPDVLAGILAIRHMHIRSIQETGLTSADEMLYPENYRYLSDILSYVAVGARSVEDQQHRLTVSGMDVPAGMKNPTSGDYSGTHHSWRCRKQTRRGDSELPLRRSPSSVGKISGKKSAESCCHR